VRREVAKRRKKRRGSETTSPLRTDVHPDIERFSGLVPAGVDAKRLYREHMEAKHCLPKRLPTSKETSRKR